MNTPPGTEQGGATYSGYGPPPQPPRPRHRAGRRFVRHEDGKWIAGVTTGIADALDVDVTVVRVIWAIVTLFSGGLGIAAYAICWAVFPSDEHPAPYTQLHRIRHRGAGYILGIVLLAIGGIVVMGQLVRLHPMHHIGGVVWAVFLIGGGLAILFLRNSDDDDEEPAEMAPVPMPAPADAPDDTPTAASFVSATGAPQSVDAPVGDVPVDDVDPTDATPGDGSAPPADPSLPPPPIPPTSSAWNQSAEWPTAGPRHPRRPRRPRRRPFLTPITISILLIGAGGAALLDSAGAVHFTVAGVLASCLVVVGLAMIVSTWFGRAHGLIPIGVILLLVTIPATAIDVPISGGFGESQHYPTTRAELQRHYELGIGHLLLQLTGAPLTNRDTSISAQLGIGELEVEVPSNVQVDVRAHVGAGHIELFGQGDGGWTHDDHAVAGVKQPGVLHLDLRVGAGAVIVRRRTQNGELLTNPYAFNG